MTNLGRQSPRSLGYIFPSLALRQGEFPAERLCRKCKAMKPRDDFRVSFQTWDNRANTCRTCESAQQKRYRTKR